MEKKELPEFRIEVRESFVDGVSQGKVFELKRLVKNSVDYYTFIMTLSKEEDVLALKECLANFTL